jgi:hypothetical protein
MRPHPYLTGSLLYAFRRPLGRALGIAALWFGFIMLVMLAAKHGAMP